MSELEFVSMQKNPDPVPGERTWMTSTYKMDVVDFCQRSKSSLFRQLSYLWIWNVYCAAIAAYVTAILGIYSGLFAALIIPLILGSINFYRGVKGINNIRFDPVPFQIQRRIEFREEGFFHREERGNFSYFAYQGIATIKEVNEYLFFYTSKLNAIGVPCSAFPNRADYDSLVSFLRSKGYLKDK